MCIKCISIHDIFTKVWIYLYIYIYMNASNCVQSRSVFFPICSTSPPGGNQVDGLPPASSVNFYCFGDES